MRKLLQALYRRDRDRQFVQGPRANGMPELNKLTQYLSVLQNKGYKVGLVTDGRMSGASGSVLAAIQVPPESFNGVLIGRIRDGDIVIVNANAGTLSVECDDELAARQQSHVADIPGHSGMGRELFWAFRKLAQSAEDGATILFED